MDATVPAINVFVRVKEPQASLGGTDSPWCRTLSFPTAEISHERFRSVLKPFKWIRFMTAAAVNAIGTFYRDPTLSASSQEFDCEQALPQYSIDLYYHIRDDQIMLPTDPNLADEEISSGDTTSSAQRRRYKFRANVVERDRACVLTGMPAWMCEAVPLVPHSKGHEYISNLTRSRAGLGSSLDGEDDDLAIVEDVDDIRNGILLISSLHPMIWSKLAFLVVPNFAMELSDVNITGSERRYIIHDFGTEAPYLGSNASDGTAVCSGAALRLAPCPERPPRALFDAMYGVVVLGVFGCQDVVDGINIVPDAKAQARRTERRIARANARRGRDLDKQAAAILDLLLWAPDHLAPQTAFRQREEARQRQEAFERQLRDERISAWLRGLS